MNTSTRALGHVGQVYDKVANGAEEVVLVGVPALPFVGIGVRIDEGHAREIGRTLDDGQVPGVTDHLRVVVLDDGLRDHVGTLGEVDQRRGHGRGVASLATAIARRHGLVDSIGVVGHTVTCPGQYFHIIIRISGDSPLAPNSLTSRKTW